MSQQGRLYGFYRACVVATDVDDNIYGAVDVFVPDLMTDLDPEFDPKSRGMTAYPANNPVGGRNSENEGSYGWGMILVPRKGDWIWIFFESGSIQRPFYFAAVNIENAKLPPEHIGVSEPSNVYGIFKSHNGRSIIVADSPDVQRTEITGKYRSGPPTTPDGSDRDPYTIDGNQTTILFDERDGKEKILIRTHKGDFLHIDVDDQMLQAKFTSDIRIETMGDLHLSVLGKVEVDIKGNIRETIGGNCDHYVGGNLKEFSGGDRDLRVGGQIRTDGAQRIDQTGVAQMAVPSSPIKPQGERDT